MIHIKNISRNFGLVRAVSNVSIDINPGELFGLIGPDGAGKTTLMRMLVTVLLPDTGSIEVNGLNVAHDYRKIRKIVGYMPGRFSLYHDLTVSENLRFYASVFGTTIHQNYNLIKDVYTYLEPFRNRAAGKLSGGMKQKLALCCALIHKPQILVLDEPTTGVDAVSRKEFWQMLKRLQSPDLTIIVSTPYMDEASLCDRIALMQKGTTLDIDTPEMITGKFPYRVWNVLSDDIQQLISDLRNWEHTRSAYSFGHSIHFIPKTKTGETELLKYLETAGHSTITAQPISPGIEDVFMELLTIEGDNS